MLNFRVVCVYITRLQGKTLEHKVMFIAWGREVSLIQLQTAHKGPHKMTGQCKLFKANCLATPSQLPLS